jgi:formate-dependent nitrite reductase membrane component NrfD
MPKRVYDTPDKGIMWGWEVSAYLVTKAIAAGAVLVLFMSQLLGIGFTDQTEWLGMALGIVFLSLTGLFLVMDLDQPLRFHYVILRPQWNSWLVRGGYSITVFGGAVTLWAAGKYFDIAILSTIGFWTSAIIGIIVAIYTAFLFAQAKGRDFWQSPSLPLHMLVHSLMAGAAALAVGGFFMETSLAYDTFLGYVILGTLIVNLVVMFFELTITHPTTDAKATVKMIVKGRYKTRFWFGVVVFGNILPIALILAGISLPVAGIIALIGIIITETIWVEAPQRIPLA